MVKKSTATATPADVPEAFFGNIEQPADHLLDAKKMVAPAFVAAPDDLIDDVLDAVLQLAPAFCAALAEHRDQLQALAHKISEQKHREYAGDRVYIPSTTESARRERGSRNAAILRDHQAGERMMLLERRYGLHRNTLWKIINSKG
jgi:Mor family transcriptional regulator